MLVPSTDILRQVMLVVDPQWSEGTHGVHRRVYKIPDEAGSHREIRFFSVSGYSVYNTSQVLGEKRSCR